MAPFAGVRAVRHEVRLEKAARLPFGPSLTTEREVTDR
jgi:hypothetical protein